MNYQGAANIFRRAQCILIGIPKKVKKHISKEDQAIIDKYCVNLYNNQAFCYLKCKNYVEAVSLTDKALTLDPTNKKAMFRKAEALAGNKEYSEAYQMYIKCGEVKLAEKMKKVYAEFKNKFASMFKKLQLFSDKEALALKKKQVEEELRALEQELEKKENLIQIEEGNDKGSSDNQLEDIREENTSLSIDTLDQAKMTTLDDSSSEKSNQIKQKGNKKKDHYRRSFKDYPLLKNQPIIKHKIIKDSKKEAQKSKESQNKSPSQ